MPNSCAVLGCKNRQSKSLKLYRFPAICKKPKFKELSLIRRNRWLTALQRDDINERNARVCAIHFISGASASLKDMYNPDWVPSLNMGDPLYPKRQKYKSNAERKEHAFADLFELIGDGETNNDTSSNDNKIKFEKENEQSKDHNYSRNLISENISEYEHNVSVSLNSSLELDYCAASADRFLESDIQVYHEPEKHLVQSPNTDINTKSCVTMNKFKNGYHIAERDVKVAINSEFGNSEKIHSFNHTNEEDFNQPDQDTKKVIIFHTDVGVDNCASNDKFKQTIMYNCYEPEQNLNGTTIYYSEDDVENCYTINQLDENNYCEKKENVNNETFLYSKINDNITEDRLNQIDENTDQLHEHSYSEKENDEYHVKKYEISDEMQNDNLHYYNNINKIYENNNNLEDIIVYKPEPIFREKGIQTYMSNNMFEYLIREIAKKNLTIQQKSSIIAEKDKKIGKLKLKLHKLRLEIYNSEVNRKKPIISK